jgi:hypothetical protein
MERSMRLITILALITFLSLPVLAVEPVYLGGALGRQMLNISATTNLGLETWGNQPLANYYPYYIYPYQGNIFHLEKLNPGIAPYYGGWIPYTLFDTGNHWTYPYEGNTFHSEKLYPGIAPYYGGWIPYTLFDTR